MHVANHNKEEAISKMINSGKERMSKFLLEYFEKVLGNLATGMCISRKIIKCAVNLL